MLMDVELRVDATSDAFGLCDGIEKYCQSKALYMLKMNGRNCLTKAQGKKVSQSDWVVSVTMTCKDKIEGVVRMKERDEWMLEK